MDVKHIRARVAAEVRRSIEHRQFVKADLTIAES